jgi:hypothetical protein
MEHCGRCGMNIDGMCSWVSTNWIHRKEVFNGFKSCVRIAHDKATMMLPNIDVAIG